VGGNFDGNRTPANSSVGVMKVDYVRVYEQVEEEPEPVVPEGWRTGSYSALIFGATHEQAARDHDAHTERFAPEPVGTKTPSEPVPEDDILRLPRGATAGNASSRENRSGRWHPRPSTLSRSPTPPRICR